MQQIKSFWRKYDVSLWLGSIIFPLIAWLANDLVRLPHIRRGQMVLLSWLLINGGFAIWVGIHVKQNGDRWWKLFVFPLIYLIIAFFYMPAYSMYLSPAYLALSYLSWAFTKVPEED